MPAGAPIRLGFVGCGLVMELKHMVVMPDVSGIELVAIAEPDDAERQRIGDKFSVRHRYRSLEEMLAGTELDAVGVSTPPTVHADPVCEAIEAGKHVLVEKPLAVDLADCRRMRAAAAEGSGVVLLGHHMRWHRQVRRAREFLAEGGLGEVQSIRTNWTTPVRLERELPAWRNRHETGGGGVIEVGCHIFDMWRFLLGAEVEEVFARTKSDRWIDQTGVVSASLANGVLGTAVITEAGNHDIEVEILGTAGRLRMSCLRFDGYDFVPATGVPGGLLTPVRRLGQIAAELPTGLANARRGGDYMGSYRAEWEHFVACVKDGARPECTLDDGERSVEVTMASVESSVRGAPVSIAEFASRAAAAAPARTAEPVAAG